MFDRKEEDLANRRPERNLSSAPIQGGEARTTKSPETLTRRLDTVGEDGWESQVVTRCSTFSNGRDYYVAASANELKKRPFHQITYAQLLDYCRDSLHWRSLPSHHGMITL